MSTGLFMHRSHSRGRAFAIHREREAKRELNEFAEMLAEEVSPAAASIRLGHTAKFGNVLLGRLMKAVGSQAI